MKLGAVEINDGCNDGCLNTVLNLLIKYDNFFKRLSVLNFKPGSTFIS